MISLEVFFYVLIGRLFFNNLRVAEFEMLLFYKLFRLFMLGVNLFLF